ncbi:hypothetical protein J7T55_014303 [Diaporthe amygdali]|uniref:uncharacterized protein n=1 Tax=Phomopsis amygdali TaxID=1214568 RepID=UPI0022FEF41D|nr:uncharacterized protein J7T55_014303 [Diaporthe amygdali]KAJ0117853.1 hypothetical protein J7T55_014303 [Diaporthe amygdali]
MKLFPFSTALTMVCVAFTMVLAGPVVTTNAITNATTNDVPAFPDYYNKCYVSSGHLLKGPWSHRWFVSMKNINGTHMGDLCHKLWKGLKRHQAACPATSTFCGKHHDTTYDLAWNFKTPIFCNPGHLVSAFWEATHNKFGGLQRC